ncbi:MAG: GGDEF domain-containing protein [Candidatus Aenigmarchaeota archaeon]|nr:GGDEF domain-containing protein [Candidatus Aenigmarchaeota archaeon]
MNNASFAIKNSKRILKLLYEHASHIQEFEQRFRTMFVHLKYVHELADFLSMIGKNPDNRLQASAARKIGEIRNVVLAEFSLLAKDLQFDETMQKVFDAHSEHHLKEIQQTRFYSLEDLTGEQSLKIRQMSDMFYKIVPKFKQIISGQQQEVKNEIKILNDLENELKLSKPDAGRLQTLSLGLTDIAERLKLWLKNEKESCFDPLTPLLESYKTFDDEMASLGGTVSDVEFNHLLAKASSSEDIVKLSLLVARKNRRLFFWRRFPKDAEERIRTRSLELTQSARAKEVANARIMNFLKKSADKDALTEIGNRRSFNKMMEELAPSVERRGKKVRFALAILDIDYFKRVNDALGHQTGDFVLKKVVGVVKNSLRKGDELFRYGGEEFALIFPMEIKTTIENIVKVCERLRLNVENDPKPADWPREITVTVSLGVAVFPDNANDAKNLIRMADEAVYTAKNTGRNRVKYWQKQDGGFSLV